MASRNYTIAQDSSSRTFTVTQDGASRTFSVNTGVGPRGATGANGADGATGPQGATGATGPAGSDATVNATNVAAVITGATEKTTPVDADQIGITDSEASGAFKRLTFANLWTWVKSKLDTALTIAGAKTWSGQQEATGQAATNGTSLMTRDLGDARYGPVIKAVCSAQTDNTTKTLADVTGMTGIALEANTLYRVELMGTVTCLVGGGYRLDLISTQSFSYPVAVFGGMFAVAADSTFAGSQQPTWVSGTQIAVNYKTVASSGGMFHTVGYLKTPAIAPTVKVQMCQNAGPSGTTSIHVGTTITFRKV